MNRRGFLGKMAALAGVTAVMPRLVPDQQSIKARAAEVMANPERYPEAMARARQLAGLHEAGMATWDDVARRAGTGPLDASGPGFYGSHPVRMTVNVSMAGAIHALEQAGVLSSDFGDQLPTLGWREV